MDTVSGVGVIDKSVAILQVLADRGAASLAELVDATGLSRPTVHRLALALEMHGLVGRDGEGRFRVGLRLLGWGVRAASVVPIAGVAGPVLDGLRDATGESAQLYVRDGDGRVCVAASERRTGLRDTVPVGARLSLAAGSGAKVLLAWGEDDLESRPARAGAGSAALDAVRRRGWAESAAEREAGVASVSAPVLDESGRVLAAVSVSGPIDRLGRHPGRRFGAAVRAAATDLERRAGLRD